MQFRLRTLFALVTVVGALTLLWKWNFIAGAVGVTAAGSAMGMWLRYRLWQEETSFKRRWAAAMAGSMFGGAVSAILIAWSIIIISWARGQDAVEFSDFLRVMFTAIFSGGFVGGVVGLGIAFLASAVRITVRRRRALRVQRLT